MQNLFTLSVAAMGLLDHWLKVCWQPVVVNMSKLTTVVRSAQPCSEFHLHFLLVQVQDVAVWKIYGSSTLKPLPMSVLILILESSRLWMFGTSKLPFWPLLPEIKYDLLYLLGFAGLQIKHLLCYWNAKGWLWLFTLLLWGWCAFLLAVSLAQI